MAIKPIVIDNLTGGRNGFDPPLQIPDDQCVEALNVDWWDGSLANKRGGSTVLSVTFSAGGPFANSISSMIRHVPGNDETVAELFAITETLGGVQFGRLAGATTWTQPTATDAVDTVAGLQNTFGASLNGMLHIAYDSVQNRLHVWDPSLSKIRRSGLATPATPTTTPDGAGALSFSRFYRVRWVDISGSDTRRRSEASAATTVVTIAAKAGVTVNRPSLASEDETHWEVEYADAAAGPWYRASQVAAATTTYDDTASTISTTNLSATDGTNYPPPSAKFIISDDNRLVMAGNWETSGGYVTPKSTRVWWTPVLGSSDIGDCERIPSANYLDVEQSITGLGGPVQGSIYVFAYRRIWKLVPTGLSSSPYQRYGIVSGIGCIRQQTIVQAEDENGNPALYFLSHRGPYRIGSFGLQFLGSDVEDLWATVNLAASNGVAHAVYHADKHQVWWFIATGASNAPDTRIVFDTRLGRTVSGDSVRKGWAKHNGGAAAARCSVMFSNTVGATMSRDLKPYIGQTGGGPLIWKCDSSATDDAGTAFQAYVDTKEFAPAGLGHNCFIDEPHVVAAVSSGVTLWVTLKRDFGADASIQGQFTITQTGTETRKQGKFEGATTAQAGTISYRIGDGSAASNQWTIDVLYAPVREAERR